ncbi:MAG: (2Fe-2S)-binding protein [Pseudomonadota bacterium]
MIVCSCNALSDVEIRSAIASAAPCARVSRVYASLGCAAKCGRCAFTIVKEIRSVAGMDRTAVGVADAR